MESQESLAQCSKVHRYHEFEGDVASHIVDAPSTGRAIHVAVLQSTQVVLVGSIEKVVGDDVEFCPFLSSHLDIGTCREVNQCVSRCHCFGFIGTVDVVLSQVAVDSEGNVEVVEERAMVRMFLVVVCHGGM